MSISRVRQQGVVSIMVTMIMMVVISLLVLGFAEIAKNEQRSSLDNALSVQAYYAAESGINDARAVIDATIASGGIIQSKNICGAQGNYTLNGTVNVNFNVSYTCL